MKEATVHWDNMGWGHMGWGWVFMALVLVGVVLLVVVLVRVLGSGGQRSRTDGRGGQHPATNDRGSRAREILDERYARGEIDATEYDERRRRLDDEG